MDTLDGSNLIISVTKRREFSNTGLEKWVQRKWRTRPTFTGSENRVRDPRAEDCKWSLEAVRYALSWKPTRKSDFLATTKRTWICQPPGYGIECFTQRIQVFEVWFPIWPCQRRVKSLRGGPRRCHLDGEYCPKGRLYNSPGTLS